MNYQLIQEVLQLVEKFDLNNTNGDVYLKAGGSYSIVANIRGAQGIQGVAGATGANGLDGKTVLNGTTTPATSLGTLGDFYFNTTTNEMFGPKTAGGWGSGVSLIGATGAQGPQGIQGVAGATGA